MDTIGFRISVRSVDKLLLADSRSDELERYNHFSREFKKQPTELIAGKQIEEFEGIIWGTSDVNDKSRHNDDS